VGTEKSLSDAASRLYWLLLAIQAVGAVIIFWLGVPLYRSFLPGRDISPVDIELIAGALAGVVLLQAPYWIVTLKVWPHVQIPHNVYAAHVALFLARLNFILASSLFVVIVFARRAEIEFVWWRALTLVAVLFAVFCFSLELERLGQRMTQR
jgi:hypothetical protein